VLVTVEPVVALNPVEGLQLYEVAPFAVSVAVLPEQIVGELTVTIGVGFTVTTAVLVDVQLPVIPVTTYVVVEAGVAVTTDPLVALNPVEGDQLYEVAPDAVSVAVPPEQTLAELTVTVGVGLTVTVAV
jgi:hypothetical protein